MGNITQQKQRLEVVVHDAVMLELVTRRLPEAASQTYKLNSPVKFSSGNVAKFVNPTDGKLVGYALTDGANNASAGAAFADVVLALPHVEVEVNFLGAAAADNVLAAADMGGKFDLLEAANLLGTGKAGWYLADATADPSHRISAFPPIRQANVENSRTTVGDTNARVRAIPISTVTHWNAT